ncbi:putative ribonuclease H-like domain-containing protein [Tanacetum coccineum]
MVPRAVLMKSGLVLVNTARQVNIAHSKTTVNAARPMLYLSKTTHSTVKRPIHKNTTFKNSNFNQRVNTVKDKNVNTVRPKAVVNALKVVVNAVKGNNVNAGNPQMDLQDQGVIDSGCSRYMTGNMSYLTDYEEIDGGYVAFGGNPKEGKIIGRGTIKTSNLDFKNVYFLTDESQVKLKVPRKNNMYSVDLKNIVPNGGLTCLFAKATSDESELWHRRIGHINFKTMNKLNKEMNQFCERKGIKREFSVAITPQQNGGVERKNRTLIEAARTMLADFKLPTTFWAEAVNTACYVQNRSVNYKPVVAGNQSNGNAGIKACDDAGDDEKKVTEEPGKEGGDPCKEDKRDDQEKDASVNNTNNVNTASTNEMDVKSAFLYGKIKEEVYVCQPLGFEDLDFPDRVYKVEKALYGLHQASRIWDKADILLVQVYVDDIIFGSIKKSLCTEFEKMMHKKFQMSSMDELTFFLGLQVKQKEDAIFISQDKYVTKILKKFGFTDVKTASTPMETQKLLLKDEDGEEVDVYLYRSMIGSLMYLTSSRPDIMFAVCACARDQVNPKVSHLHAIKRIFRYLKGQLKLGLWYPKDSPFDLVAYINSDYAGASLDRKSTTGEAEYVAASSFCGQVLWIQNQLLDYGQISSKDKTGIGYGDQLNKNDSGGSELFNSVFNSHSSDGDDNQTNDRLKKDNGYHAVPPPVTGNYMPPLADLSFTGLDDYVYRPTANKSSASVSQFETSITPLSNTSVEMPRVESVRPNGVIIEDWIEFTKARNEPVKLDKQAVKPRMVTQSPKVDRKDWNGKMTQKLGLGFGFTKKACFVCGSHNHLIKDCDFHEKRMPKESVWERVLVIGKSGRIPVSTAKHYVNTATPKNRMNVSKSKINTFPKSHSPIRRPFYKSTVLNTRVSKVKVNTVKVNGVNTARKIAICTVKGNGITVIKASVGCGWRPKMTNLNNGSKDNNGSWISKRGNPQQALKYKGMFDSGCSRHMTRNKALLTDYQDIDGGFVAFGGSTRGGKITVLLRVSMQSNMYNFDLKNFVPSGDLTCLFAKAIIDESKLWHRRLGHVNFKTMNKLVKGNLIRGLPSKIFDNDHTCVAC